MLLEKDTYFQPTDWLISVNRRRCCLMAVKIGMKILILFIFITYYFRFYLHSTKLQAFAGYSSDVFQVECMLAWALTPIKLYKNIKNSEKLFPKKRIFVLHGYLLIGYLFIFILQQILVYSINHTLNFDTYLILAGIATTKHPGPAKSRNWIK